jgi:hypothetical protein
MIVQRNKRSRLLQVQNISSETRFFRGTQKRPKRYQPETVSAVLMKYLVESDKKRQAEQLVDLTDAFFKKHCSNSKNVFSLSSKHLQVKNICDCIWSGIDRNFRRNQVYAFIRIFVWLSEWTWDTMKLILWCKFCSSPRVRICATEFVYIVQYGCISWTVSFSIKHVMNFLLFTFLATVSVCFL